MIFLCMERKRMDRYFSDLSMFGAGGKISPGSECHNQEALFIHSSFRKRLTFVKSINTEK